MNRLPIIGTLIRGWRATFRLILRWLARLRRGRSDCGTPRRFRDRDCLTPPVDIRARPDPYIYSQEWLSSRGFAVTWDNPDFRIIDTATGAEADRLALQPNHDYTVEATIHNNSFMAALGTQVGFEVRSFGIGTPPLNPLPSGVVDVPAFGVAIAHTAWHTPASGGHNCLRALIHHLDDANPLNNVGQHNTDVAVPQSPERGIRFLVGGHGALGNALVLRLNAYTLPDLVDCPQSFRERASVRYLRALQERHDRQRFPVPKELGAVLSHDEVRLGDEALEVVLSFGPEAATGPRHAVNVEAFDGDRLVGGITTYVGGEVI